MARMGAAHLAPQGGGYEPQRKFDFELRVTGAPGWDDAPLVLAVQSFNPPGANNEVIELGYLNEVIKVAGQGKWDAAEVVVRDMVEEPVYSSLMEWKALVHNPIDGSIGFASQYKKQGELTMLAPDGSSERKFKLIGLWPSVVRGEQFDYTAGTEIYRINVTLQCDKVQPMF